MFYDRKLKVFISSRMEELAPERRAIKLALKSLEIDAWTFEDCAGARPQSIQQTYIAELAESDLYVGVFWRGYGDYTIDEFDRAHSLKKDRLVYEKRADIEQRDPRLDTFLKKIGDVTTGLATQWFHTAEELAARVQTDVRNWQTNLARQALAQGMRDEHERQVETRARARAAPRQRVVSHAPQGVADLFKDRSKPMADILDTLLAKESSHRVVTVYGQGGTGKTALACRVMKELEQHDTIQGLVYLSTRTKGISFQQIYDDSGRMLGGKAEQRLIEAGTDQGPEALSKKIQLLLEAFGNRRYVLLLDNLEAAMDEHGVLADLDLQRFLDAFMSQNHGARLLVTTREPLHPSSENRKYQKLIPLEDGLPVEFAIELLRDLDEHDALGLRSAEEPLLKEAAEKALCYPVALESIISILSEGGKSTLRALLDDREVFNESVIGNLVRKALSRLNEDGHRVMQALAVFGRPVREVAVHYLLEPYADGARIQETLRRLTRGLYVNVNRTTGELILHPLYREFSYSQIPIDANVANVAKVATVEGTVEGPAAYTRAALETRAAAYYAQLRTPREAWKSIRDLEPELYEFEHWLRAGEYDRAAEVLSSVDLSFLIWQGYARRVRDMRAAVEGRIRDRRLQLLHHDSLGQVSMILGPQEEGIDQFKRMKDVATEIGDLAAVGSALRSLGESSRLMGRHDDAIAYSREALTFFRQQGSGEGVEHCLFFLGLACCYGGYAQEAMEYGEEMLRAAMPSSNVTGTARTHNVLALASLLLERWDEAVEHAQQAITAFASVDSFDGICFVGNVEAMALFGGARHDEGLRAFERTLAQSREYDMPRAQALVLFNQARAFRTLKRPAAALDSANAALAVAVEGHFQSADPARALIDALNASARGDRATELRRLLDCARASLTNPDVQAPGDLAAEVEAGATELGNAPLAGEAAELTRMIRSRHHRRSGSAAPAESTG